MKNRVSFGSRWKKASEKTLFKRDRERKRALLLSDTTANDDKRVKEREGKTVKEESVREGTMVSKPALPSTSAGATTSASAGAKKKRTRRSDEDVVVAKKIKQQGKKKTNRGLPDELWAKILEDVDDNSVTAFASASKQLRRVQKESGRKLKTDLQHYSFDSDLYYSGKSSSKVSKLSAVSEDWCA